MKRILIGFAVRLGLATLISTAVWWLVVTPFDRVPLPQAAVFMIVRVLNFPAAVAGELLPIRGFALVFRDYSTWCDFCTLAEATRQQLRVSIPAWVLLLYIPLFLRPVVRRARLWRRIVIGLCLYALFVAVVVRVAGGIDARSDARIAAIWFLILSGAAAFAWSRLPSRWRAAGVLGVIVAGGWWLPGPYDVPFLSVIALVVFGVLGMVWLVERGVHRSRMSYSAS
jgi:hypothetical protein